MKKLSIIVPVYNMVSGGRLRFCLDSLVNQTLAHDDYEIVAVDDCSTDDSYAMLGDYAARFPERFVVLKTPENLRQGGAKNLGLAHAKGAWIGFVDSDDFVAPAFYERLLALAAHEDADMAGCDLWRTKKQSFADGYERIRGLPDVNADGDAGTDAEKNGDSHAGADMSGDAHAEAVCHMRGRLVLDGGYLPPKIFKRNIVYGKLDPLAGFTLPANGRVPVFPEKVFYEDNAAGPVMMARVTRFAYLPDALYYYYQGGEGISSGASTTRTVTRERLKDRMRAAKIMLEHAKRERYTVSETDGARDSAPAGSTVAGEDSGESDSAAKSIYEVLKDAFDYRFTQLFYVNTLFSAMQSVDLTGCYSFTRALVRLMKKLMPDFMENPYYKKRTAAEEQELIEMQMKSHLRFYAYYRALWMYRTHFGKNRG
ncbi:MAG: glycosyltransferase family 2 protein [Lachnospiraceae bacterium]|nr:glycosyltransferase family 2 protein [Lachnospiraceae bacterium]